MDDDVHVDDVSVEFRVRFSRILCCRFKYHRRIGNGCLISLCGTNWHPARRNSLPLKHLGSPFVYVSVPCFVAS